MIIEIDDKLTGAERREQITIQLVLYAMLLHDDNRTAAARWMGFSGKGFRLIVDRIKKLNHLKGETSYNLRTKQKRGY